MLSKFFAVIVVVSDGCRFLKEITSLKLERNVEVLWMHLSSRECAETQLVKILPLWLKSELDDVEEGNYQVQIGKKCANFMHALIKSRSC